MIRSASVAFLALITLLVTDCGVETRPHYEGKKFFGAAPETVTPEVGVTPDASESVPEIPEERGTSEAEETTVEEQPEAPAEEEAYEEVSAIDPHRVIFSGLYRGAVNFDAVRFINWNGQKVNPQDYSVVRSIMNLLPRRPDAKIFLQQEYGDGQGGGLVKQSVFSNMADLGVYVGRESGSGSFTMQRGVEGKGCGSMWVCLDQYVWKPTAAARDAKHDAKTYCFYDRYEKKMTSIPYSPSPLYSERDYDRELEAQNGVVVMGPYDVLRMDGAKKNCDEAHPERDLVDRIMVRFKKISPAMKRMVALSSLPKADFAIEGSIEQLGTPLRERPYVDETTRLQHRSRYYISESAGLMVKLVKDVRLGLISDSKWNPVQGLFLEMHFEYCQDFLQENGTNHCEHLEGQ